MASLENSTRSSIQHPSNNRARSGTSATVHARRRRVPDQPLQSVGVHRSTAAIASQAENAGSIPVTRSRSKWLVRATTPLTSLLRVSEPSSGRFVAADLDTGLAGHETGIGTGERANIGTKNLDASAR
jgi:hypothetical protein